ncbi:MAG: cation:proton antiporter [Ignavibacteriaceae bacterium]|jgi:CPA2 family monovalent cation:H+ antiporter-2
MEKFLFIKQIVIILSVAIPIIFLFKKLKMPSIIGFLIAGVVIGPYGLKLISSSEQIETMAEIGVILLMFTIGLEFSLGKLVKMKKLFLYAGTAQVGITVITAAFLFSILGIRLPQAVFFGMLISLSSTAIVLKILVDKNELDAPQGKISVAILIFQDLIIVPMMIMLPILGAKEQLSILEIIWKLLFAFGAVSGILFLARFFIPKILFQIANLRIREVFTIGILLLILGTAYLTESIGLSFSIGAFIAGIILAESDFNHEIIAEILPFKDAFNSLFFISIGLLLNISFLLSFPLQLIGLVVGIIIIKSIIIMVIVLWLKFPSRIAVITGVSLAQIGEFSFVLAQSGAKFGLIGGEYFNAFLAASIFTMILTPILISSVPVIFSKIHFKGKEAESVPGKLKIKAHVVIVGFGLNGKNLAKVLKETGIPYVIIELNPETVALYKERGENILYGDVTKREIMSAANISEANIIVFAISAPESTKIALRLAKQMNPKIFAIVRTRYISEIDELKKFAADEVIPEEFETSLQIFNKVLAKYHIPLNVIMKQVAILRGESYQFLRKENEERHPLDHIEEILAQGLTETFYVSKENSIVGKSLKEIDLRAKVDVTIIAIVRGDKTITNPSGSTTFLTSDTLVLTGTHAAVDRAITLLSNYS